MGGLQRGGDSAGWWEGGTGGTGAHTRAARLGAGSGRPEEPLRVLLLSELRAVKEAFYRGAGGGAGARACARTHILDDVQTKLWFPCFLKNLAVGVFLKPGPVPKPAPEPVRRITGVRLPLGVVTDRKALWAGCRAEQSSSPGPVLVLDLQ